ncbi:MAG: adenosine deaminase [Gammaproteobacteria bacterium]|nr:adenosine deaminase [Gammaproteobacteria bacterium]
MDAFIRGLPKAELHCHIEGALEPELMFELAARNRVELPFADVDALRAAYDFGNLQDFLDLYYQGMRVLQSESDFYELTRAYLQKAHAQNIRHAEIFFDPQAHVSRGVAFADLVGGITAALGEAEREAGITSRLIMCFLRDRDEEDAFAVLEMAEPHRAEIAGVGLDSAEAGNPPEKFARVFAEARARGYRRVAHAGEEGPAEYVRGALDALGAERIDHGNAALGDAQLMERLAREGVPLTMCPLSNLKLRVVSDLREHPLKKMLERGLCVTVNSDDPSYFGGYINENYRAIARALDLERADLAQLARNSITASFAEPPRRAELLGEVERYCAPH